MTKCQVANDILQKKLVNVVKNTINFLHQTSKETLRSLGVRDRFYIIIFSKKFIEYHNLMNEIKAKDEKMRSEVYRFEEYFNILFENDILPSRIKRISYLVRKSMLPH